MIKIERSFPVPESLVIAAKNNSGSYEEKDVVERELCKMYEVYKSWGGQIRFWDIYTPRYYSK